MARFDKLCPRVVCCEVCDAKCSLLISRVNGTLPEEVREELERRGIPYRPRDGSSRELDS
jgi:hypothetical protein